MLQKDIVIKSNRNSNINCTIVESEVSKPKLLLLIHGFKADRFEDGRFTSVALQLAKQGVNSIMLSFAGCDGSDEDFINYSLTNDLDDIELAYKYMLDNYDIDVDHIGMIGYSMGGRLTSIFIDKHEEVKTIGIWAGACQQGFDGEYFLGGKVEDMINEANKIGYCNFFNVFDNTTIQLSKQLLDDMTDYDTYKGLNKFTGNAIVVHGDKDTTVDLNIGIGAYNALNNVSNKELVIVKDANHGFGIWDNHPEQSEELVNKTIVFFEKYL